MKCHTLDLKWECGFVKLTFTHLIISCFLQIKAIKRAAAARLLMMWRAMWFISSALSLSSLYPPSHPSLLCFHNCFPSSFVLASRRQMFPLFFFLFVSDITVHTRSFPACFLIDCWCHTPTLTAFRAFYLDISKVIGEISWVMISGASIDRGRRKFYPLT